jgi:tetratricopeptide (TPR) repeat protein
MADKAAAQRAHADYYLDLLVSFEKELYGPSPLAAVRQLRPDRENIYQAWHWAVKNGQYEALAATLPSLLRFSNMAGLLREGEALLRQTRRSVTQLPLAHDLLFAHARLCLRLGEYETVRASLVSLPPLEDLSPIHRLEAHLQWGELCIVQTQIPESRYHTNQSLTLARALGNEGALISSLIRLHILHDYKTTHQAEVLRLAEGLSDRLLQQHVYNFLGGAFIRDSHYSEARAYWQKALAISLELEHGYGSAVLYNNLGDALRESGEFAAAAQSFQQSIALYKSLNNPVFSMNPLEGWARLCVLRGDYPQAILLAQEAIDLAVTYDRPTVHMSALTCLGHAYAGLQLWAQAEEAYAHAAVLAPDLPHLAMESLVGLAYASWQQEDEMAARASIDRFLDLLADSFIEGFCSPSLSYGRAAEVLRALGEHEQADAVLASVPC